jgi:hypothetical protein
MLTPKWPAAQVSSMKHDNMNVIWRDQRLIANISLQCCHVLHDTSSNQFERRRFRITAIAINSITLGAIIRRNAQLR